MPYLYPGVSASNKSSLIGLVTRKLRKSEFTHAYIRFEPVIEGVRHNLVFHSVGIGSVVVDHETFAQGRTVYAEWAVQIDDTRFKDFIAECLRDSGRVPYGRLGNLGLVIAWMLGLKQNPFDRDASMQRCSETAARKATRYYGAWFSGKDFNLIWPTDFFDEHMYLESRNPDAVRLCRGTLNERRKAAA